MRLVPVVFDFVEVRLEDGEIVAAMVPQERYRKIAKRQFHVGEPYPLVVLEARSRASHSQYFAALNEGYNSLPEEIAPRWATSEHFRKWCLIETGWFDEKEVEFASTLYAKRFAAFFHEDVDEYARLFQPNNGTKVIIRRAKSQSSAAMGKDAFEESKRAVLDLVESMIGVKKGALNKQAGKSA